MTTQSRLRIAAVLIGMGYGLVALAVFRSSSTKSWLGPWFTIMTYSFVFLVPFVLGFLTVYLGERERRLAWSGRIFLPWVAVLLAMVGAALLAWEGLICIVMMLPVGLVLSTLGGLVAVLVRRVQPIPGTSASVLLCSLALPFVAAPIEHRLSPAAELRVVRSEIAIAADPATVWANIEQVPEIEPAEHRWSWFHAIGFPRPVAATLSRRGLGGVRHATFAGGVLFVETIDRWEPGRRLAFSIHADPATIPPTTLDEHVTVGGPYFDVLRGEYALERVGPRQVVLHLQSTHRLATRFNAYSRLWTDHVMSSIQGYILEILKRRCESGRIPAGLAGAAPAGG